VIKEFLKDLKEEEKDKKFNFSKKKDLSNESSNER
jgi:hypothetical protein